MRACSSIELSRASIRVAAAAGFACMFGYALTLPFARHASAQGTPRVFGADHYNVSGVLASSVPSGSSGSSGVQTVAGVEAGAVQLAGGDGFSLVLLQDGTVRAWGAVATADDRAARAVLPVESLHDVASIAAGRRHALALGRDGAVWTWAMDPTATSANGAARTLVPTRVAGLDGVVSICAGDTHSLALRSDGTVWSWSTDASTPPAPVHGLDHVRAIACGSGHDLAVHADGTVSAWGRNTCGQLGSAGEGATDTPRGVEGLPVISEVAAGGGHSLALGVDGSVWAWGCNNAGQLGDRTLVNRAQPQRVAGLDDARSISAGAQHSIARRANGTVWAWGGNIVGQLGDPTAGPNRTSPGLVRGVASASQAAAGRYHTLVIEGRPDTLANIAVSQTLRSVHGARASRGRVPVLYEIIVVNHGPDVASQVQLSDVLPADAERVDVRSDRGTCRIEHTSSSTHARCDLGEIADGDDAVVEVRAWVAVDGARANSVTASTTAEDPDALDDRSDLARAAPSDAHTVAAAVPDFERP